MSWVQSTCAAVPASAITGAAGSDDEAAGASSGLYDCANVQTGIESATQASVEPATP